MLRIPARGFPRVHVRRAGGHRRDCRSQRRLGNYRADALPNRWGRPPVRHRPPAPAAPSARFRQRRIGIAATRGKVARPMSAGRAPNAIRTPISPRRCASVVWATVRRRKPDARRSAAASGKVLPHRRQCALRPRRIVHVAPQGYGLRGAGADRRVIDSTDAIAVSGGPRLRCNWKNESPDRVPQRAEEKRLAERLAERASANRSATISALLPSPIWSPTPNCVRGSP